MAEPAAHFFSPTNVLSPVFEGTILLTDCAGYSLGEWDTTPCDGGFTLRQRAARTYLHVLSDAPTKPIDLRQEEPIATSFKFETHPCGTGFAIKCQHGYVQRQRLVQRLWRTLGWRQLTAYHQEPENWGQFFIEVRRSNIDTLLRNVAPPYQLEGNEWVVDSMLRCRGGRTRCVLAAAGLPGSGKSTLLNAFSSVIAGTHAAIVQAGGQLLLDGHFTLRQQRIPLIARSCAQCGREAPADFELTICDLVGMRTPAELRCALLGKTRSGELWPTDRQVDNRVVETALPPWGVELAVKRIERRPASPDDAAHCLLLVVPVNTMLTLETGNSASVLLRELLHVASNYAANTSPARVSPLTVRLVITQVDQWARRHHIEDPRCLLGGSTGLLKPLYDAACQKLRFAANDVTPIGWLNSDQINYADATDPRVVVLKSLLCQSVQQGCQYANGLQPVATITQPPALQATISFLDASFGVILYILIFVARVQAALCRPVAPAVPSAGGPPEAAGVKEENRKNE